MEEYIESKLELFFYVGLHNLKKKLAYVCVFQKDRKVNEALYMILTK